MNQMNVSNQNDKKLTTKKGVRLFLAAAALLLAVIVAALPGILHMVRRADAQVALGNAKSLRLALQAAGTEAYGAGQPFYRAEEESGLAKEVWTKVLLESKAPGEFWILQTDQSGYEILRFLYQEGDFSVMYQKEPLVYEVYYQESYIKTRERSMGP